MLVKSNHVLPSFPTLLPPAEAKHDLTAHTGPAPQRPQPPHLSPAWESASSQAGLCRASQPCTQPGVQGRAVAGGGVGPQIQAYR